MITLIPITVRNWERAASLEVEEHQREYIRSNAWSIAESLYHPELKAFGIYNGGTMVGFLMYGIQPADDTGWLVRFMIDRAYQGQGLGKQALAKLIRQLCKEGYSEINVGWDPRNTIAEHLYLGAGFQPTGLAPWGEKTAQLKF